MLNPDSPLPLYHQLAEILTVGIRSGEYAPGDRIPSEHQLAADYGIGRPTVRQAVDVLVGRRLVTRRRGAGTFVRAPQREVDLFSLAGTTAAFEKKGVPVNTHILAPMGLKRLIRDRENPFYGVSALFFSRLTRVERTPVLCEDLYLHPVLFKGIATPDLSKRSLSAVVAEQFYMRPTNGKQTFRIGSPSAKRAGDLGVTPKTPVLIVRRFLHFPQAKNAIYSELFCRTDQFVFSQEIGGLTHD